MADQRAPLGEFEREDFVFTVYPDGEVHRVEARQGNTPVGLICHVYRHSDPGWSSNWWMHGWKPWIGQQARRVIAEAEQAHDDHSKPDAAQPDHIAK